LQGERKKDYIRLLIQWSQNELVYSKIKHRKGGEGEGSNWLENSRNEIHILRFLSEKERRKEFRKHKKIYINTKVEEEKGWGNHVKKDSVNNQEEKDRTGTGILKIRADQGQQPLLGIVAGTSYTA